MQQHSQILEQNKLIQKGLKQKETIKLRVEVDDTDYYTNKLNQNFTSFDMMTKQTNGMVLPGM